MERDNGLGAAMALASATADLRNVVNALGQPSPGRTDFRDWSRENLEAFARQAADENLVLRADNKALLRAWRQAILDAGAGSSVEEHVAVSCKT